MSFILKPCQLGETITVFYEANNKSHKFISDGMPILIELETKHIENMQFNAFLDTSGSMDQSLSSVRRAIELLNVRELTKTVTEDGGERWVNWFTQGLSSERPTITFCFINEANSVYHPGHPTLDFALDLASFHARWIRSQLSYGVLFVVTQNGDPSFYSHVVLSFLNPKLDQASYSYTFFDGGSAQDFLDRIIQSLPIGDENRMIIKSPPSNQTLNTLRGAIQALSPDIEPLNGLIPDWFFSKKVLEVKSSTPIKIKIACASEACPPGYCKIDIAEYPGYCCLR